MNRSGDCHERVIAGSGVPPGRARGEAWVACDTVVTLTGHNGETGPAPSRICTQRTPGHAQAQIRTGYRRHRGILALLAALACLAGFAVAELKASPSGPATSPPGTVSPGAATATPLQARLAAVSWPADGASAADVSGFGVVYGPGATRPAPIASVAKVMTAYVILHDHPLTADRSGPDIEVQPSEAAAYPSQARDGDSLVPVVSGEMLTERRRWRHCCCPRPTTWPGYSRGGTPAARPRS